MPKKARPLLKNSQIASSKNKSSSFLADFWPAIAILLATLVFFYPVWTKGYIPLPADFIVGVYHPWLDYKWGWAVGVPVKNPITTDVVSFTYPMQMLAIDLIKSGQWPLWNPYILGGAPLLANFQSAPFSPTNFVYFLAGSDSFLFDHLTAWSIQIMLQHLLAALFTYFLLRHWQVSKWGSVLGGLVFAFSGFNLIWSQWNGHALTAAFIPLLLFFQDRFLLRGRWYDGAGVSAALAAQIFSGYPQVVLYTALAAGLLWLVRFNLNKEFLIKTALLAVFGLVGLGLAAAQILPGKELIGLSQREVEPHPYEWAFLPWSKTITFFAPDFFGNHATGNWWGPQDYTSNTGFVGSVAATLAILSVFLIRAKKEVLFGFVLLVAALLFSFPTPFSIFFWESGFLGLQAASAHRALVLFNLAVALLAAFGVDYFLQRATRRNTLGALAIPAFVLFGFGTWAATSGIAEQEVALKNLIFPIAIFILAGLVLFVSSTTKNLRYLGIMVVGFFLLFELFRFGWKFNPFSPRHIVYPTTPVLEFLTEQEKPFRTTGDKVIPINLRMPYKIETVEGYDAVYPLLTSQFISAINTGDTQKVIRRYGIVDNTTSHLLDLVNTKYYLVLKKDTEEFDKQRFLQVAEEKSVVILENKNALPRAFLVYDWETENTSQAVLQRLLDPNFPLAEKVLLEEEIGIEKQGKAQSSVVYEKYTEQESVIEVQTEKDGVLFVSDTWYPGWKAYVDGKEQKIYKANYAFRAVAVSGGKHEVRFIYEPESFFGGLKIAVVSLFLLFVFSFFVSRKR